MLSQRPEHGRRQDVRSEHCRIGDTARVRRHKCSQLVVIVVLVDLEVNTIKVVRKGEIGVVRKSKKEVVRSVEDRDTSHVTKISGSWKDLCKVWPGKETIGLIAAG